jgi:hypothetical protein
MPDNIDLDSIGLRHSTQSTELGWQDKVYSHSTISLKKLKRSSTKACLVLFSSFCTVGAGSTCWVHSHQVFVQSSSRLTYAIDGFHRVNLLYNKTINCFSTLAQSSRALNEIFNYKQVLQEPDYHEFVKGMVNKVDDHEFQVHWTPTKCCDILPWTKTIMSILSFKRKQYPDGTLNKHKAPLCVHGGMQTWGQNYWVMYAPVVKGASVHILLLVKKIHGLSSKSKDFILAFPQADLEIPGFMELPLGFDAPDRQSQKYYVLQLN